eukprot:6264202-Amphidinium_carterae.1
MLRQTLTDTVTELQRAAHDGCRVEGVERSTFTVAHAQDLITNLNQEKNQQREKVTSALIGVIPNAELKVHTTRIRMS